MKKALLIATLLFCGQALAAEDGTTENMKPALEIANKSGLKVLIQVNSEDTIPNGVSKQLLAAKNLYEQYAALGMKSGQDYEIVMIFRAGGAQFLLTDQAYETKLKAAHGNPNRAIIEKLAGAGVKMYECQVSMKMKGYQPADILPFARPVASGIGAIVDFEKSGYLEVTP